MDVQYHSEVYHLFSGSVSSTDILTPLSNLPETVENAIGAVLKPKTLTPGFPDSGRKMAILEQKHLETLPIQIDNKYGNLQEFVAGFSNPKPIVDTIQEHEKYGNDGDQFRNVANVLIAGVEGLSNALNAAVEVVEQLWAWRILNRVVHVYEAKSEISMTNSEVDRPERLPCLKY
ncbi:hypothetical protein NQ314_012115 [Rhamnusium bicolor]|uniref:Uncharacterized protein n=1 Tax=Rhamnusium bicolor TaxID=1586634 RepID=A0AAV8XEG6_9CUCU|nr:hypothetical protein NQ314_012115 [Rhamnusium bicolor]